ncbi:hypothetical protein [Desulfobacter curvatus]|nr:hypothetical protein [Desulfobacter curvatus]
MSKELEDARNENKRLQAELDKSKEPDLNNLIPELKSKGENPRL